MKIAYISGSILPSEKANSVHVMKMCQALSKHGKAEVTLFGKTGHKKDLFSHYGVRPIFQTQRSFFGKLPVLSGLFRLTHIWLKAKILGTFDVYYGRDIKGLRICANKGKPIFFEAHQIPKTKAEKKLWNHLFHRSNFKGIIVISEALKQDIKTSFPNYKGPILVAHDGADLHEIAPTKIAEKNWPGRKKTLQIGYTGSLHKGRSMETISQLAKLVPEVDFHVVGGDAASLKYWKSKASFQNLYFHGNQPHKKIPAYLARFDIVLAPYRNTIQIGAGADIARWISPLKLFEYMAAGKSIICADIPVIREVLEHGRNAHLVDPEDISSWIESISLLSKNKSLRTAMGEQGRKDILEKFSWDIRAKSIMAFIQIQKV